MFKSLLFSLCFCLALSLGICPPPAGAATPVSLPVPSAIPAFPLASAYGVISEADCVEAPDVAPAAAVDVAPLASPGWRLKASDQTLKAALLRWAAGEGWQLVWEAPVDYAVEQDTIVGGGFEQAIEAVVRGMAGAATPLQAIFYKGNRVLRIVAKGAHP